MSMMSSRSRSFGLPSIWSTLAAVLAATIFCISQTGVSAGTSTPSACFIPAKTKTVAAGDGCKRSSPILSSWPSWKLEEHARTSTFNKRRVLSLCMARGKSEYDDTDDTEYDDIDHDYELDAYIDEGNLYAFDNNQKDDDGVAMMRSQQEEDEQKVLEYSIDSFLSGEYDRPFSDDAPAPHPGLTPRTTLEAALKSLRQLNAPEPNHGAAVFMRFCKPLSRGERWGSRDQWIQVMRGAITPTMLARRLRASGQFSGLLDWTHLDVTEGAYSDDGDGDDDDDDEDDGVGIELGVPSCVAFVNAALYYEENVEPSLLQFTLRKTNGVWLIDSARLSPKELFVVEENDDNLSGDGINAVE